MGHKHRFVRWLAGGMRRDQNTKAHVMDNNGKLLCGSYSPWIEGTVGISEDGTIEGQEHLPKFQDRKIACKKCTRKLILEIGMKDLKIAVLGSRGAMDKMMDFVDAQEAEKFVFVQDIEMARKYRFSSYILLFGWMQQYAAPGEIYNTVKINIEKTLLTLK